ncbi:hypothetical protein [Bacillus thuringiensis]|uniref:hypothetical protein n=1 Tax=Bacillus thuringiensis TaxID=1428 RepID=UPI000BFBB81D|nr:hypothetical protein [Bacillus thuringiensis]PGT89789.1 hypothetical protein COD17_08545 [Bacillus thuringiensis]
MEKVELRHLRADMRNNERLLVIVCVGYLLAMGMYMFARDSLQVDLIGGVDTMTWKVMPTVFGISLFCIWVRGILLKKHMKMLQASEKKTVNLRKE